MLFAAPNPGLGMAVRYDADRMEKPDNREDETKFPEGAIERRFFTKMLAVLTMQEEAARLGQTVNPLDPVQKDQVQRIVDVNLDAQKAMAEAMAILQETDEPYDRELIGRVLKPKPLP